MKTVKCPRCNGPAKMIDKAPRGEAGDVIRCDKEETCSKLHEASKDLERSLLAMAEAGREIATSGSVSRDGGMVSLPYCLIAELREAEDDWKKATHRFLAAVAAHGNAGPVTSARRLPRGEVAS